MGHVLEIINLCAGIPEKVILKNVNLKIKTGEVHVIMGPNGAGKSTLSNCIMGNPKYEFLSGDILLDRQSLKNLKVDERARLGIFMSYQQPMAINGVKNSDFLRQAMFSCGNKISLLKFLNQYEQICQELEMPDDMMHRYLNVGFSGGEMKRNEILQMKMLKPKIALLDEIDSGLDIDALKIIGKNVSAMINEDFGCLLVTHHKRLLDYIVPQYVHVMINGQIVKTGGKELIDKIESEGYTWIKEVSNEEN